MANHTINDRLFAVKPVLFYPTQTLTQEDLFVQELVALQTLSRLGLATLFSDIDSSLPWSDLQSPGYWNTLSKCVDLALIVFDQPKSDPHRFPDLVCQMGKIQALLAKGLEQLHAKLPEPESQLCYNYLSIMWDSVLVLLEQKGQYAH
jgi:hypothetical protein